MLTFSVRCDPAMVDHDPRAPQYAPSKIRSAIFQDETWTKIASTQGLNPVLIGQELHKLNESMVTGKTDKSYIVLVTGDKSGDIVFYKQAFLDSLRRPHVFDAHANEVVFTDSNITLNVEDVMHNPECISMDPRRLFFPTPELVCSASLYLHDSYHAVRKIEPEDIVGIGGKAPTLENASMVCGITLKGQQFQQCFLNPKCGPIRPIPYVGYNEDICLGWEWK
jgi:hypothetical protein